MADKHKKEHEIAVYFSSLPASPQRKKYVDNLDKKYNAVKVINFLNNNSLKVEFLKLSYKRNPFFNKTVREYKKQKKDIIKKLNNAGIDYNKAKSILNPLRENNETLLRLEALKIAGKSKKNKPFINNIIQAESIAELVKENNFNTDYINKLLLKNYELIKNNEIVFDNLKDIFEYDKDLNVLQNDFNDFIINYVDNEKTSKEIIKKAEKNILTGNISNIYSEIEKTEKLLSKNIPQNLINVYNAIQVMDAKRIFVSFIENHENSNISSDDIAVLINTANEYRNIDLPKKWADMRHKLKFTNDISHFNAWYYGLRQGMYKNVVSNVKEYIVSEIFKIILNQLNLKIKDLEIIITNIISLITGKLKDINKIKNNIKNLFELIESKKMRDDELVQVVEDFFIYYLSLDYDLKEEKAIMNKVCSDLSTLKSLNEKIDYLKKAKNNYNKNINDDHFIKYLNNILDNFISLYIHLNNKTLSSKENITKNLDAKEDETVDYLNKIFEESLVNNNQNSIVNNIKKLPHDKDMEIIPLLKFDQRFEEYYPDVEDVLYKKDWGRTIGVIAYKIKDIEKKFGVRASEDYLSDFYNRVSHKFGVNSLFSKKIKNLLKNLESIHKEGAKKLHYLKEKLLSAKNSADKIIELQRISRDPRFKGIFGAIKNMERILIRDNFEEIYERTVNLPVDTQKVLFEGVREDLKNLLKFEPDIYKKIEKHIEEINYNIGNSSNIIEKINEDFEDSIEKFEKKELPLVDFAEIFDIKAPDENKYSNEVVDEKISSLKHESNSGLKSLDDLEQLIENINNDVSFFKIDNSKISVDKIKKANELLSEIDKDIEEVKALDELQTLDNIEEIVKEISANNNDDIIDKIDKLETVFNKKNYTNEQKIKGFDYSIKKVKDPDAKNKLKEIVEVIRRIDKEINPLLNLETKVSVILKWMNEDYKDKDHIVEFLSKQIDEMNLQIGREGGLLRKLFDGLDQADDKIKYLKECLNKLEYRYLIPAIKNLLDNINSEINTDEEKIDKEWVDKMLEGKTDDEKINWLKPRKYWNKYQKVSDAINGNMEKCVNKLKRSAKKEPVIYNDFFELVDAVLELSGSGERQGLIKYQLDNDKDCDNAVTALRKLLFYLMGATGESSVERLKSLSSRVTLPQVEKQKYLQLLKKNTDASGNSLKEKLGINDSDIAYHALSILYTERPQEVRVKLFEKFKISDDGKVIQYKDYFEIDNKIIDTFINDIKKKKGEKEILIKEELIDQGKKEIKEDFKNQQNDEKIDINKENLKESKRENISDDNKNQNKVQKENQIDKKNNKEKEIKDDIKIDKEESIKEADKNESDQSGSENYEELIDDENADKKEELTEEESQEISTDEELNKNQKLINTNNTPEEGFTEQELKELLKDDKKPVMSDKSTQQILSEQKIRNDFKKREKDFIDQKNIIINKRLDDKGIKLKKETAQDIQKKAHEINEKNKEKIEDKLSEIIVYLTNCYPEAVVRIIDEEILPVFREEGLNLNIYNMLNTINTSVFKPAFLGKDVKENLNFIKKSLAKDNFENISMINDKIMQLWKSEEKLVNKEHEDFEKTLFDINQGRGITSILVYLNNLSPENIFNEIDNNFLNNINNKNVKEDLTLLRSNLIKVYNEGTLKDNKDTIFQKMELKDKHQDILNQIIEKIKKLKKPDINKTQDVKKELKESEKQIDQEIKNEKKDIDENEQSVNETETNNNTNNKSKPIDVPEAIVKEMSKLDNFVKPHVHLIKIAKIYNLSDEVQNVESRKNIIDTLYKNGIIFTYDGSTYIGEGQISKLIKNESIPKLDRSRFVDRLDEFLKRFMSKEDVYYFMGVKDESELRSLNFILDKYGTNRIKSKGAAPSGNAGLSKKDNKDESQDKEEIDKTDDLKNKELKKTKEYKEKFNEIVKNKKEKQQKTELSKDDLLKKHMDFVNKNQKELLKMAANEINNSLKNLIKSAGTKIDLEAILRNYFQENQNAKKNLVNLCSNLKQIADILREDKNLLNNLTFDKQKLKKMIDDKMKKFK